MIDKTYRTELSRIFLIETLPEPLTRASAHLQIFDNYIEGTRMRIRSVRDPETKAWQWALQQRFPIRNDLSEWKVAEIHLNETEHAKFEIFEGIEIRKNRYFHEFDERMFAFDVYLRPLWGLNRSKVEFENRDELEAYEPPPFAVFEVTGEAFFSDENLVRKQFSDIQDRVSESGLAVLVDVAAKE